ncbi:MAG: anti-sigma factor antagonist [Planctomycetota bacterium]|nr:MAG: anti-sigma factor antagonist [Planctomycetota bacterium]
MKIETHIEPRYAVLSLAGDFETYAVSEFLDAVQQARQAGRIHLILNMRRVKFMNTTAIGAVLRARKELSAAGGGLAMAPTSGFVRDVFKKLGLDSVIPHYENAEEAARALRLSGLEKPLEAEPGDEEAALLFRFYDQAKADELGGRGVGAGEIALLDVEGITFSWDGRGSRFSEEAMKSLLASGTELEVKFRLPLYSKATYYVSAAEVAALDVEEGTARVRARFLGLEDEAATAVRQYVADMTLLREEIQQAKGD